MEQSCIEPVTSKAGGRGWPTNVRLDVVPQVGASLGEPVHLNV